jgi:hypothetical protein
MSRPVIAATAAVAGHALVVVLHGLAHQRVPVPTTADQSLFVLIVIVLGPLVALALLATRYRRTGAMLLAASMAASLVFGVYHHFIAAGPDNVISVPADPWGTLFRATAILLALTEGLGWLAGSRALRSKHLTTHEPEHVTA